MSASRTSLSVRRSASTLVMRACHSSLHTCCSIAIVTVGGHSADRTRLSAGYAETGSEGRQCRDIELGGQPALLCRAPQSRWH
jgi:hypothetical protein